MRGCLLAPFKLFGIIFRAIGAGIVWCWDSGIKGFVVAGAVILLIGLLLGQCNNPKSTGTVITTGVNLPTKVAAPYYVTADAKTYFMEKYHWQGSILIIENYWESENGANRPTVGAPLGKPASTRPAGARSRGNESAR